MNQYTLKDISKLTDIPLRLVQFYADRNIVEAEIQASVGRGTPRVYSDFNLLQFQIIKGLSDIGVVVGKIQKIISDTKLTSQLRRLVEMNLHTKGVEHYVKIFSEDGEKFWAKYQQYRDGLECAVKVNEMDGAGVGILINIGQIKTKRKT